MQETTNRTHELVHQVIAGRILQRLTGRRAQEEQGLRSAVATIQHHNAPTSKAGERHTSTRLLPQSVITKVLKTLAELGMIRRVGYKGATYIAARNATRDDLIAAIKRHTAALEEHDVLLAAHTDVFDDMAKRISYFEAANVPELGDSSQEQDAYTFEGACTSQIDAELLPDLNNERFDTEPRAHKPISDIARRRIAYQQERPHIPANNARNAQRRWLKTEDGAEWLKIQRLASEQREAEQVAFSA